VDAGNTPASTSFVRDRVTVLVYCQFAMFGYFLYAFTPSVDLLRGDEHVSRAISALHGTGLAVGAITVGVVAPRLVERFGRSRMMWVALSVMCAGVGVLTSCRVTAVTITGAVIAGFGGTMLGNLGAAILTTHHRGAAGGAAVTEGTGVGSGFGLFAPLMLSAAIATHLGWRAGMLVLVVVAAIVATVFARSVGPVDGAPAVAHTTHPKGRLSAEYWRACAVLVMTTAIEFSMTIWSSDVLHNHLGLSTGTSATGVTAIVAGMTIGRLLSGRLALRYAADALLIGAFALTILGFAVFWASTIAWLAFVGLFVTGLGISLHFPLAITRAIGFADGRADLATSYASLGTGLAIALAPFGLGAFADQVGSHTAMLLVPVFVVLAAIGVLTTRRPPAAVPAETVPLALGDVPGAVG
jgi:MFS family permease